MKRTTRIASLLLSTALVACSSATPADVDTPPPPPGHTYALTIQGSASVFLGNNGRETLYVRYADDTGAPIPGLISFKIEGTSAGATLSNDTNVTDPSGIAQVEVAAGATGEAVFKVTATAEYATAVQWSVAVSAGPPPPAPLSVSGTYVLDSQFNLVNGLPGTVGTVVNTVIDMTDGANDPATWLIDMALAYFNNSTFTNAVNTYGRPLLDSWLNDIFKANVPSLITNMVDLGNKFGQVTRRFGIVSTLQVTPTGATHTVQAFVFVIDGVRSEWTLADLGMGAIQTGGVSVTMGADGRAYISDHTLPVSYGRLLLFALNEIVIPMVDPGSHSLADLLQYLISCPTVGAWLSTEIGIGSASLYQQACEMAITAGSNYIEQQILSLDGTATSLVIHGDAKPLDTNGDRVIDQLQNGLWEGKMNFGPVFSTLAKPEQKFNGLRQGAVP